MCMCESKKPIFIKEPEHSGLLSNLTLKIFFSKIAILGDLYL